MITDKDCCMVKCLIQEAHLAMSLCLTQQLTKTIWTQPVLWLIDILNSRPFSACAVLIKKRFSNSLYHCIQGLYWPQSVKNASLSHLQSYTSQQNKDFSHSFKSLQSKCPESRVFTKHLNFRGGSKYDIRLYVTG